MILVTKLMEFSAELNIFGTSKTQQGSLWLEKLGIRASEAS